MIILKRVQEIKKSSPQVFWFKSFCPGYFRFEPQKVLTLLAHILRYRTEGGGIFGTQLKLKKSEIQWNKFEVNWSSFA